MSSTNTAVPPRPLLPAKLTKVSIQSTAFPNVYLRSDKERPAADGINRLVNLQVNRSGWERHELIEQDPAVYGPDVFVIHSVKWPGHYQFLDPTVFPEQKPREGTTFHPRGVGRVVLVTDIKDASRFKIVVNVQEGETPLHTFSFKLVGAPASHPNVYLRLNGDETTEFRGPGSGEVNGQTYIGAFEKVLIEHFA